MAAEFFDYDPHTGVQYLTEQDGDITVVQRMQDVQPLLDKNKAIANSGLADGGIKEGWWHVCDIPPVVWLEMKKIGLDIFTRDDGEFTRCLQHIQTNYPYLKTTHKKIA
jgi:hypothetical protein